MTILPDLQGGRQKKKTKHGLAQKKKTNKNYCDVTHQTIRFLTANKMKKQNSARDCALVECTYEPQSFWVFFLMPIREPAHFVLDDFSQVAPKKNPTFWVFCFDAI